MNNRTNISSYDEPSRHICYLANMRVPTEKAHGYQIFQMCQAFIQNGCVVDLVVPSRKNSELSGEDVKKYYHLHLLPKITKLKTFDLITKFQNSTWQYAFNLVHSFTFLMMMIPFLLRKKEKTIIFYRDIMIGGTLSNLFFWKKNLIWAYECHHLPQKKIKRDFFKWLLLNTPKIVSVTKSLKLDLQQLLGPDRDIIDAPDGFDPHTFNVEISKGQARSMLGMGPDNIYLGFVGKFHTNGIQKGIPDIINSAGHILTQSPKAYFLFVGGPLNLEKEYRSQIERLGLPQERFQFIEKRPIQEVPLYMRACDILLMPHPDHYFFRYQVSPLKLFEYLVSARPIIASRLPAIEEILEDGKNALLVTPGSAEEIAIAYLRIINDSQLAEALALNAKNHGLQFSWENRAKKILDFII